MGNSHFKWWKNKLKSQNCEQQSQNSEKANEPTAERKSQYYKRSFKLTKVNLWRNKMHIFITYTEQLVMSQGKMVQLQNETG